jgi:hypothetical protein
LGTPFYLKNRSFQRKKSDFFGTFSTYILTYLHPKNKAFFALYNINKEMNRKPLPAVGDEASRQRVLMITKSAPADCLLLDPVLIFAKEKGTAFAVPFD